MSTTRNSEICRRFFDEVVTKGNLSVVDEICAPGYRLHATLSGAEALDRQALKELVVSWRSSFPDGTIATWQEAYALHPEIQNGYDETSGISDVVLYIPGARYHDIERRAPSRRWVALALDGSIGTDRLHRTRARDTKLKNSYRSVALIRCVRKSIVWRR